MDKIYKEVHDNNNIVYLKLQFKGIGAHSLVITEMKREPNGYKFKFVDSNSVYISFV
jgi:hypothetical protein